MLGLNAHDNPSQDTDATPVEAYFLFVFISLVAMCLDANHLRQKGVRGKHRLVRHIWRMSCALFFATATLFTGPGAILFPESVRGNLWMLVPQAVLIVVALSWICKVLLFGWQPYKKNKFSLILKDAET